VGVQGLGSQLSTSWTVSFPHHFNLPFSHRTSLTAVLSHTICTFVFLEFHRKAYRQVQGIDEATL
jgi:hypothetical protein